MEGVTGRYFEDNQESEVVEGGAPASWSASQSGPSTRSARRLWKFAQSAVDEA